jgi:murein DD-endopeptidase MepM/ murein hydrolase activator NlpD
VVGTAAVALILACAGCVILATALGATLSSRNVATEQAAGQATLEAPLPERSPTQQTAARPQAQPAKGTPLPTMEPPTPLPVEDGQTSPLTDTTALEETVQITASRPATLPLEAGSPPITTGEGTAAVTVQPVDLSGPAGALELTPTMQLTLSSVIFIENVGQFPDHLRFQVRGAAGGGIWLAPDAIWLTLLASQPEEDPTGTQRGVRIRLGFVGANPSPQILPLDRLDTRASYLRGDDPAYWPMDVPVWGGVRYQDLYPGVDLELTSRGGDYVQRLVVHPGADLGPIRLRVEGVEDLALEPLPATAEPPDDDPSAPDPQSAVNALPPAGGSFYLRLTTALGDLSLPLLEVVSADGSPLPPLGQPSLETLDGSHVVKAPFLQRAEPRNLPETQRILPSSLPADDSIHLLYSALLGRGGNDTSRAVAVDATGSAYVAGETYFPAFPAEPGAFDAATGGDYDAVVVKINAAGSELAYVTFLGGRGDETGYALAVDAVGNAYLAGATTSTDLPVTAGAFDREPHDALDGFVARINALGGGLDYGTYLGGDAEDWIAAIAVDAAGNAYVTGATHSTNFPATVGAFDVDPNGGLDAFAAEIDGAGKGLVYSTLLGGTGDDRGTAIAVDAAGDAYVAGATDSAALVTTGAFDVKANGGSDAFALKVSATGTALAYATLLGGAGDDDALAIAVDAAGRAYVAGATQSPDFPTTPWAFDTTWAGGRDAFVTRLDPSGSRLEYATFLGGDGDDWGQAIVVDEFGYACLAGTAASFTLPDTIGAFDTGHNGGQDAFVVRIDELGTGLSYATFLGGDGDDQGRTIAIDAMGSLYVAGTSDSAGFALPPGGQNVADQGYVQARLPHVADAFVTKLLAGVPFLDLPVAYDNFDRAAQGNVGDRGPGRVNSWFDHNTPNHATNRRLTRWDGTTARFTAASPSRIGESWYDGHGGIDFRWDVWDEPIFAAAPGRVIDTVTTCRLGDTSCGNYFGNRVWIDHGNGYATVYAHLKTVAVTVDTVIVDPAAQPLGIMGNTGRSLGTHLHFGLYYDWNGDGQWTRNEVVDPYGWMGTGADPWDGPSRYLWKEPLWSRQLVGSSAATLVSPSGLLTVTIPAGAFASPTPVELWDVPPTASPGAGWYATGEAFRLTAGTPGATLDPARPILVSLSYRSQDLLHLDPGQLTLYRWDGGDHDWEALSTEANRQHHQVVAQVETLGRFDLHAPLLCPADGQEPDDQFGAAQFIAADGVPIRRLFDVRADVDWFRIEAERGKLYAVQTSHLAAGVSTILKLYDPDSLAPLASARPGADGTAHLQWRAPGDGSYLVQVSQGAGGTVGCQAGYALSIRQMYPPGRVTVGGPAAGKIETTYTFTASVGPAAADLPVTYVWQIGARPPVTHTSGLSDSLTFRWTTAGDQVITVTAQNVAGVVTAAHTVALYPPLVARFSASPTSGQAPLRVSFTNTSDGTYTASSWDFGDGKTSTSQNPAHTYQAAGTYTVTLTVSNLAGSDVLTRTAYVEVAPASVPRSSLGYHVFLPLVRKSR